MYIKFDKNYFFLELKIIKKCEIELLLVLWKGQSKIWTFIYKIIEEISNTGNRIKIRKWHIVYCVLADYFESNKFWISLEPVYCV